MNSRRFPLDRNRAFLAVTALCLCTGLSGCLFGSHTHTENSGQYVSESTLSRIEPGKDKAYVIALIGEPTTKVVVDSDTEIWKWCYTQEVDSSGHLIFIAHSDSKTETRHTTFVEFCDSKVTKAWTD